MMSVHDDFLKGKEMKRKITQNRAKMANVSNSTVLPNIYKKPSSLTVLEDQRREPYSSRTSATASHTLCHAHLSQFFSFLQKSVIQTSNTERKENTFYTRLSDVSSAAAINKPKLPALQKCISSNLWKNSGSRANFSQWLNQQSSSISVLRAMEKFPTQYRLPRYSCSCKPIFRDPATAKTLTELYLKTCEEGNCEYSTSCSYIQPDEALRCRYLRLSESNIAELLQRCKDSGIHVDIHPHMKESDIDINTVMSLENMNTLSL